jgi:cytidine deaminase
MTADRKTLGTMAALARRARDNAYAPYSDFRVGVALLADDGNIYVGANCETATYKSNCAERSAITAMTTAGGRKIRALVLAGPGEAMCTPCGSCRQDIREFSGAGTRVYALKGKRVGKTYTMAALLPDSFGPENLKAAGKITRKKKTKKKKR